MTNCLKCAYAVIKPVPDSSYTIADGVFTFKCPFYFAENGQPLTITLLEKDQTVTYVDPCSHFEYSVRDQCLGCRYLKPMRSKSGDYSYFCVEHEMAVHGTYAASSVIVKYDCQILLAAKKTIECPRCATRHSNKEDNDYCRKCTDELKKAEEHLLKLKAKAKPAQKTKVGQRKVKVKEGK